MKTYRKKIDALKLMGHRLKTIRQQLDISKKEMSGRLLITPSAYNKYESGDRYPAIPTMYRLFKDLNISMNWLLFEKAPMHLPSKDQEKELKQSIANLESKLNETNQKSETQANERNTLSEENKTLKEQLQTLETENSTLRENVQTLETENQKLQQETQTTNSPEFNELMDGLKQNPLFYHEMQLQYQRYKIENKD